MRAYLSDGYSRMSHLCAVVPPYAAPATAAEWRANDAALVAASTERAVAEASRILAATEPDVDHSYRVTHAAPRFYGTGSDADYAASALAEALASFVAG